MSAPLADLRVLDLTVARAGPACVRQLADWGADVVRVEARSDPAGITGADEQNLHRNKRSITLDLKDRAALAVLLDLVATADVLVENLRPAVKDRLGFGWDVVHARNPRLVYGSISGFGQDGPYRDRPGVDQVAQGLGGLMSVTGLPGTEPTRVGIPVSDLSAGLYLAVGILVALHERARTGEGRWVQTSLLESMIGMMDLQAVRWTIDGEVPAQEGNHHPTLVPMGCFASADGHVNVAGPSGRLLHRFCEAIGLPDLPSDPRFDSLEKRSANRAELNALVAERLRTRTTAEWVDLLNDAGVPCGPVLRMDEVFADEQVRHLDLAPHGVIRNPVRIVGATTPPFTPALRPGQHTDEILEELRAARDSH